MSTVILLFTAAAGIQLVCWIALVVGFRRATVTKASPPALVETPISVVVAVRDGAQSLPALLRALKAQVHTAFEIIVIDDHSIDQTPALVRTASAEDGRIRLVNNPGHGKKAALTAGIAAASYDLLAFTDADCVPDTGWLSGIARLHGCDEECVVAGYGPHVAEAGFLNRLVRYETLHTALLTASSIGLGTPYMAVGRNLSYRKSTFERLGGHGGSTDLLSGDDDLFVQWASADGVPVRFMSEPTTFVYSQAPGSFAEWVKQKHRHLSTGSRYTIGSRTGLMVYHFSAVACWVAPVALGWIGLIPLLCRLGPAHMVLGKTASALEENGLAGLIAPLDLAFQLYLVLVAPIARLWPPRRW